MSTRVILILAVLLIALAAGWTGFFYWKNLRGAYVGIAPAPVADMNTGELIRISYPLPNTDIKSPLRIVGEARGNWFFEGSFPILLIDENGRKIAEHYASAKSDWMTENFVPYEALLEFTVPHTPTGTLVLKKDNPSGLLEHDAEVRIPVRFKEWTAEKPAKAAECKKIGCSGQICSEQDIITTCEWRAEYACYRHAICERNPSGECGWRETPELKACLQTQ